jgi:hypothetical protein
VEGRSASNLPKSGYRFPQAAGEAPWICAVGTGKDARPYRDNPNKRTFGRVPFVNRFTPFNIKEYTLIPVGSGRIPAGHSGWSARDEEGWSYNYSAQQGQPPWHHIQYGYQRIRSAPNQTQNFGAHPPQTSSDAIQPPTTHYQPATYQHHTLTQTPYAPTAPEEPLASSASVSKGKGISYAEQPQYQESSSSSAASGTTWANNPKQRFIGILDDDKVTVDLANTQRKRNKIPKENCADLTKNTKAAALLSVLDLYCRLDLQGHGNKNGISGYVPKKLAVKLHDNGLRKVGVVKFQSCDVGSGQFQEEFIKECDSIGIAVGYSSAPIGDLHEGVSLFGKKIMPKTVGSFKTESSGMRVIKGNAPPLFYEQNPFQGSRYTSDAVS